VKTAARDVDCLPRLRNDETSAFCSTVATDCQSLSRYSSFSHRNESYIAVSIADVAHVLPVNPVYASTWELLREEAAAAAGPAVYL